MDESTFSFSLSPSLSSARLLSHQEPLTPFSPTVYSALESKDLSADHHALLYASRPSRADRKASSSSSTSPSPTPSSLTPSQSAAFTAQQIAAKEGNVETPFKGIEDEERRPRGRGEMRDEAERLSGLFPEGNRGSFGEEEEEETA
jgi:hypothetical protein